MVIDETPRRLHPATILLTILRGAPSTLLGLPALLALTSDIGIGYAIAGALAITLVAAGFRWIAWRRFTYALTGGAIVIESGVFSRNRRIIPFDRVQDVDIERKLLARLFGLAKVCLETGGSDEDEGDLDSVSLAEAHRLRDTVRRRALAQEATAIVSTDVAEPRIVFAMGLPRVLLWGFFNFSLVWLAVIFGTLQYVEDWFGIDITERPFWDSVGDRADMAAGLSVLAWAWLALVVLLLGVFAGLVRTLLRDYGFTLFDEGARYRRSRGLLTHSEVVVALARVQLAIVDTGLLRRTLGWARLRVQTLGGEGEARNAELAPFARPAEIDALLVPLGLQRVDPAMLRRVASGHVVRAVLRQVGLPGAAIIFAAIFFAPVLFALPLLLPVAGAALLRRRYHRYGMPDATLTVQRGVLGRTTWIVPARHVQVVSVRRSWLQRRLGVATVHVDTAGGPAMGGPSVQDVRVDDAWELAAALRERRLAARTRP